MATLKSRRASEDIARARSNVTITKKTGSNAPTTVRSGTPLDHTTKHNPCDAVKFGMSKGVTKNMGDYESLRVDVWLIDEVQPGETIEEAYIRVEEILDRVLEESILSTS